MTDEQRKALDHLGRLTETGRSGGDPSLCCTYEVGGDKNGIQLFQMGVTDADMRNFSLLPGWHYLTLRECPVSDAGLKHLSGQQGLRFLDIGETEVTTLHPVRQCVHLRQLWCDRLELMTDRKAVALANFRALEFLDMAYTNTGDATTERLARLTKLRKLNLLQTKVTDTGLQFLGQLPHLEMLSLQRTAVSDSGVRHLQALRGLRLLVIGETSITKKGRAALMREIPGLKIEERGGIY